MCQVFLHALLGFNLASLEVVVYEPSVNPRFFLPNVFDEFFTRFWGAFPFRAILFLLFFSFGSFPEAVDEGASAFAIAPNASVRALGLRNLSHSVDPSPEPVFLSPPPSPSPFPLQLLSLALVTLSSSY